MDTDATTLPLAAAAGDACPACGAPVSGDQHYCVECGERQAAARTPPAAAEPPLPPPPPPPPIRRRTTVPAGATLITGVATLLIAMAVGVLIGRSGHDRPAQASAPVRVVTVPSGGTATAAATPTPAAAKAVKSKGGAGKHAKAAHHAHKAKAAPDVPVAETKQKPGSDKPPPVVKVGQAGHGQGYKDGKFTGDFFGP